MTDRPPPWSLVTPRRSLGTPFSCPALPRRPWPIPHGCRGLSWRNERSGSSTAYSVDARARMRESRVVAAGMARADRIRVDCVTWMGGTVGSGSDGGRETIMRACVMVLVMAMAGCSGTDNLFDCTPGKVDTCPCAGGGQGVQTCGSDGTFGACECGSATGTGGSSASSSAGGGPSTGTGGATGSGGSGTGGAPAGCDLHPAADGFMCIDGCPAGGDYPAGGWGVCGSICWGNVGGIPYMINLGGPPQDIALVFPADPLGHPDCGNDCQFTTGTLWSYTLGMAGSGCARLTTSGPGGFSDYQGRPNNATICGAAAAPSCFLFDGTGQKIWDYWVTYAAQSADEPFWIRIETAPGSCQGGPLACN